MSTSTDRIALPGGGYAVPNGDGSYTVGGYSGSDASLNGVWIPGDSSDSGAMYMDGYGWYVHK